MPNTVLCLPNQSYKEQLNITKMINGSEMLYYSPTGMTWRGNPSKVTKETDGVVFAFFNNPIGVNCSCIVEIWKKESKRFLGVIYKNEIKVVGIFRVKNKI